jgi:hypothetical protein
MTNYQKHICSLDDSPAFRQHFGPRGTALIKWMERFGVLAPTPSTAWVLLVCVILFASTGPRSGGPQTVPSHRTGAESSRRSC